jgi:creatinine amidohydrolase/Fe(II)-dependent formamide hydrolase-like protein
MLNLIWYYSSSGVIGDPTRATPELGATLWAMLVEGVALTFKELAETTLAG